MHKIWRKCRNRIRFDYLYPFMYNLRVNDFSIQLDVSIGRILIFLQLNVCCDSCAFKASDLPNRASS